MSTKNLARTVIEGGRAWSNCRERRHSNGQQRVREKRVVSALLNETELDDVVFPSREKAHPSFRDKLGPAERWLARQVGRPWNRVRSDLFERFDSRTTAGRHILHDHLLPSAAGEARQFHCPNFTMDRHGILRRLPKRRFPSKYVLAEQVPSRAVLAWLDGRRVVQRGAMFFWLIPTRAGWFRQHRSLNEADAAIWLGLAPAVRMHLDQRET